MEHFETDLPFETASRDEVTAYLYDMIEQMAQMARRTDQAWVATLLEGIVIAQRAMIESRLGR